MKMTAMKPIIKKSLIILLGSVFANNVFSQTAPNISYSNPQTYNLGATITSLSPANTGGSAVINGQTSTVAGNGTGYINGTGTGASFNQPLGLVIDALGNVYVADDGNEVIRKITPAGVVSTFAGTGYPSSASGPGASAGFYHPVGMCIDAAGNIYIADEKNQLIQKMTL